MLEPLNFDQISAVVDEIWSTTYPKQQSTLMCSGNSETMKKMNLQEIQKCPGHIRKKTGLWFLSTVGMANQVLTAQTDHANGEFFYLILLLRKPGSEFWDLPRTAWWFWWRICSPASRSRTMVGVREKEISCACDKSTIPDNWNRRNVLFTWRIQTFHWQFITIRPRTT